MTSLFCGHVFLRFGGWIWRADNKHLSASLAHALRVTPFCTRPQSFRLVSSQPHASSPFTTRSSSNPPCSESAAQRRLTNRRRRVIIIIIFLIIFIIIIFIKPQELNILPSKNMTATASTRSQKCCQKPTEFPLCRSADNSADIERWILYGFASDYRVSSVLLLLLLLLVRNCHSILHSRPLTTTDIC